MILVVSSSKKMKTRLEASSTGILVDCSNALGGRKGPDAISAPTKTTQILFLTWPRTWQFTKKICVPSLLIDSHCAGKGRMGHRYAFSS